MSSQFKEYALETAAQAVRIAEDSHPGSTGEVRIEIEKAVALLLRAKSHLMKAHRLTTGEEQPFDGVA